MAWEVELLRCLLTGAEKVGRLTELCSRPGAVNQELDVAEERFQKELDAILFLTRLQYSNNSQQLAEAAEKAESPTTVTLTPKDSDQDGQGKLINQHTGSASADATILSPLSPT